MNLAIRGIFADIRWNQEGTLKRDAFPDERFDFALANPPFNISDWEGEALRADARWKFAHRRSATLTSPGSATSTTT